RSTVPRTAAPPVPRRARPLWRRGVTARPAARWELLVAMNVLREYPRVYARGRLAFGRGNVDSRASIAKKLSYLVTGGTNVPTATASEYRHQRVRPMTSPSLEARRGIGLRDIPFLYQAPRPQWVRRHESGWRRWCLVGRMGARRQ